MGTLAAALVDWVRTLSYRTNQRLYNTSPLNVVAGAIAVVITLQKLKRILGPRWGEQMRGRIGRLLLNLAPVRTLFRKEFIKSQKTEAEDLRKKWAQLGEPLTAIPPHGFAKEDLMALVDKWQSDTNAPLAERHFSGTIYSRSLVDEAKKAKGVNLVGKPRVLKTTADLAKLATELEELYTYSFRHSYLWNSLHGNEFGVGDYLTYQVVQMVANMFGGRSDEVMGFCTSGGTESLMLAMRCYRNWGIASRNHAPGESVVIVCESVHAAVNKAGEAYHMEIVAAPMDDQGKIVLPAYEALIRKYGRRVVALVGSAPQYAVGCVDPIEELSALAVKYGVGLHVDCCLGGFIVNHVYQPAKKFLQLPGVTSLSADTHKNGWAPKGSSVLVTRPFSHPDHGQENLAYWSVYAIPGWTGGVYGSPRDPGSQQVVSTLHAFLAMAAIGTEGYKQIAEAVLITCQKMAAIIGKFDKLQVVSSPQVNVVTFRLSDRAPWGKGAIYALAHELEHEGFTISNIKGNMVHFCVTGRLAMDESAMAKFENGLRKALAETEKIARQVSEGGVQFKGAAGMYGKLEAALEPTTSLGAGEYLQNWLLGTAGALDAIRGHFLATFNPYRQLK